MYNKILAVTLLSSIALSVQSATLTVSNISITGGDFGVGAPAPADCSGGFLYACIAPGNQNPIDTIDGLFEGPTLTSFNLFDLPVTTWTAATAVATMPSTSSNPIQGTVDTVAGTISLDMGSLYSLWNGEIQSEAPRSVSPGTYGSALDPVVSGTFNPLTGAFDLAWTSVHIGGATSEIAYYWHLTGVAAAVPEPWSYALMLAGLGLVSAAAHRRKAPAASA